MVKIPSRLEELLPAGAVEKVLEVLQQPNISGSVREAFKGVGLEEKNPLEQVQQAWRQARSWLETLAGQFEGHSRESTTINASGSLLNFDLSGVPMSSTVSHSYAKTASSFQFGPALCEKANAVVSDLTHGASGVWLADSLFALQVLQQHASTTGGIVLSRTDAVRVPGFGDVRSMLTGLGQRIVEVGAANGATEADWKAVLKSEGQMLLLVSPNGLNGKSSSEQREVAVKVAKQVGAQVVELLIDGVVNRPISEAHGFPLLQSRLEAGADLVILPLNVLLGGPSGVLVCGKEHLLKPFSEFASQMRVSLDAPSLSAAFIAIQMAQLTDEIDSGIPGRLLANTENLRDRAHRLSVQLNGLGDIRRAELVEQSRALGPAPWDRYQLPNWSVRLTFGEEANDHARRVQLAESLRKRLLHPRGSGVSILATVEDEALVVDLRFVAPADDHAIVTACRGDLENAERSDSASSVDSSTSPNAARPDSQAETSE